MSTEAAIKNLRIIYSAHKIPEQLYIVSDNGSGFASLEFSLFMKKNRIKHTLTSLYHPSSSGLLRGSVHSFKNGVQKLEGDVQKRISKLYLGTGLLLIVPLVSHLLNC